MAIEAPISKFKKNNLKLYAAACLVFAIIFAYDGYLSKYQWSHRRSFYENHLKDGKPDDTMRGNRVGAILLVIGAVALTVRFQTIKNKKLVADDNELVLSDKEKISLERIQKIDKTHFDAKGYFIITYKDKDGNEVNRKLSDKTYDNLTAILDLLVTKIS